MFIRKKLSNGLRVICEHIPYVKSVSIGIWVGVGSRLETSENNGISHFAEHMMFKGTKKRTAQDIAEEMDFIGGHLNAFTSREYTCYYAKSIDSEVETSIDILSDMYINSRFLPEDIELERRVILEEISMYEDSPEDVAIDLLTETVWNGSSLGFPVTGTSATVSNINRASLVSFTEKYYTAKNTVIAVAGNFEEEKLYNLLEKYFGSLNIGDRTYIDYDNVEFKTGNVYKEKDIEQSHLCIGFQGISQNSDEIYALATLNNILGNGMSSRLFQKIRETRGLAYSVYSTPESFKNCGMFYIYAGLSHENIELVKKIILDETESLLSCGVTEIELKRGSKQLRGNYIMELESVSGRMNAIGKNELLFGRVKTPDEILHGINGVDNEAINKLITKIFKDGYAESIVTGTK